MTRIVLAAAILIVAMLAIWHPAPHPALVAAPASSAGAQRRGASHRHRPRDAAAPGGVAVVYVAGAVRRAGLYRVGSSARVNDAVTAAGGLAPDADPVGVNLAARVSDGEEIAVPRVGERLPAAARRRTGTTSRRRSARKSTPSEPIALNEADAAALARVPGIGPTIAARIVALRAREGPYDSLDELLDVAGMTPSRLGRAGSYLRI